MNDEERYLFDLQGFLVIANALSTEQLMALNTTIDHYMGLQENPANPWFRHDGLLGWGSCFRDLIDPEPMTSYLQELLGNGYRLDHEYVHVIQRPGPGPIGSELHGGGTPYDPCQYYHYRNGQMYNGLTAIAYNLTDVYSGDGGFGCIPGSHKSNLRLPRKWADLTNPPACVQEITGRAGTAIIFTEALTHGTLPWQGKSQRRTLFYKYSPRASTYSRHFYDLPTYPDLTAHQQYRLKTPGIDPP